MVHFSQTDPTEKVFWLDRTDPFCFRANFPDILVEWIMLNTILFDELFEAERYFEGERTCKNIKIVDSFLLMFLTFH